MVILGAGYSRGAGYPLGDEITKRILSGERIFGWSNDSFQDSSPFVPSVDFEYRVPRIKSFMPLVNKRLRAYFADRPQKSFNYEDAYSIIQQVLDDLTGENNNPCVEPFRIELEEEWAKTPQDTSVFPDFSFVDILDQSLKYISDALALELRRRPIEMRYSADFIEFLLQLEAQNTSISTTNYDMLLEESAYHLGQSNRICDGFTRPLNGLRFWNPELFNNDEQLSLIKLHGSLNWFHMRGFLIHQPWRKPRVIQRMPDCASNLDLSFNRPVLLLGSVNKLFEYSKGIFADLQFHFVRKLSRSGRIVVCGYSFRDKGINSHIVKWLYQSHKHRMLIINPNIQDAMQSARPAITAAKQDLERWGQVSTLECAAEDVDWTSVKSWLHD